MKLQTALALLVFGTAGYFGYGLVTTHTSSDVLAYKSFTRALMRGDQQAAERLVTNAEVLEVFQASRARESHYNGHIKFTYHQVLNHEYSPDRETVVLKVRQVTRLDPKGGKNTLLGSRSIEEIHRVILKKERSLWRISSFQGPYTQT